MKVKWVVLSGKDLNGPLPCPLFNLHNSWLTCLSASTVHCINHNLLVLPASTKNTHTRRTIQPLTLNKIYSLPSPLHPLLYPGPDGHQSSYEYKFLWQNTYEGRRTSHKLPQLLWTASTFPKPEQTTVSWEREKELYEDWNRPQKFSRFVVFVYLVYYILNLKDRYAY